MKYLNKKNIMENLSKKTNYESPSLEISFIKMEAAIAAGSVVRRNPDPLLSEWQDVETVDIWNF
ncbi:hypothetical protein [Sphingobacterium chungjuense]|uniref:hypothetical protein n=1 Tax=Sphingobacterium chungjuense TaxID=2675553 RepID=UPI00140D9B4B|nr:hypothetical protein [Sphingobacterium chungjuense]